MAVAILSFVAGSTVGAQSITTGAIGGTVTDEGGSPVSGAQIRVTNSSTGFTTGATSRENGNYLIQGLEVGGGYSVTVRRIGFNPQSIENLQVALSQVRLINFQLQPQATQLATVQVLATNVDIEPTNMGTKSTVSDTLLQRLPVGDRNLADFLRLTPQVSQSGAGYSAGGMSNRMNNVQVDGATERDVFGLGSTGQPGAQAGARSVSMDAVKELQVILAPFDVRQGNFGGLLLNAVTKSGTNSLQGSAFYYFRNEGYGRDTPILRSTSFERKQYGFTLGGPIVRDRLHFFVAPEFREEFSPLRGPYRGQPTSSPTPLQIAEADLDRFETIMEKYGTEPGTAGAVTIPNPADNFFARLDYRVNDVHRVVLRYNYGYAFMLRPFTNRSSSTMAYSSNFHDFSSTKNAPVLQLFSNFANGSYNELFIGYNQVKDRRVPPSVFPQVTVSVPRLGGGNASIVGGADQFSQKNELDQETFELTNNFTRPFGNHSITLGTRNELVKIRNQFNQSSYGVWTFSSLDNFDAGTATSFRRSIILKDDGNVDFDALQSAVYVQDQWQKASNLTFTVGLRLDISNFLKDVPYTAAIDSAYGRRTDDIPKRAFQFSPRVGFNWDIGGNQVNQLRGGVGMFVGTPPYVWLENAYINSGQIITFLNCNTGGSRDPAPRFNPDPTSLTACGNGAGFNPIGAVNFLDKSLKFPQPLRATLGYDRVLPGNVVATFEGLFSKTLNQFFFVNRNLAGIAGKDRFGRTIYSDTILTSGVPVIRFPAAVLANGGPSRFNEAFDIVNQNEDYAYNLTAQLRRRYADNWEGSVSYTYSRARDVQSFSSSTHSSNWAFGRTYTGDQLGATTGVSNFDQPHKILATGTRTFRFFGSATTDLSFFYQGVSGSPHDYIYGGFGGRGDLNADSRQGNDLVYVPKNALDPNEIQFRQSGSVTPAQQAAAFETFIQNSPCLSKQRGKLLARNSCRTPFSSIIDVSLRQAIPTMRGQRVSVQLDVFNFGDLVNNNYGKQRINARGTFSNVNLLTHVGQTTADAKTAIPIVQFNVAQPNEYVDGNFASNFWRTQLSVRYSF